MAAVQQYLFHGHFWLLIHFTVSQWPFLIAHASVSEFHGHGGVNPRRNEITSVLPDLALFFIKSSGGQFICRAHVTVEVVEQKYRASDLRRLLP
jgi:hypothetical protein